MPWKHRTYWSMNQWTFVHHFILVRPSQNYCHWLVFRNMIFIFPFSWECHHPNWLSSYFSEECWNQPPTIYIYIYIETIIYKPSKDIKASNQLCNSTVLVKNISWSTPLIWLAAIHGAGTLRCPAQRRKHHLEGGFWSKILGDLWMNSQRW